MHAGQMCHKVLAATGRRLLNESLNRDVSFASRSIRRFFLQRPLKLINQPFKLVK